MGLTCGVGAGYRVRMEMALVRKKELNLRDIFTYKKVGVTELRDKLKDFIDDEHPVIVSRDGEDKKVLVDYDMWMQMVRDLNVRLDAAESEEDVQKLARMLQKVLKRDL